MKKNKFILALLVFISCISFVVADENKSIKLYHKLINEIRCMVCQNQNIAESQAPLAIDLRNKIKKMIEEGKDEKYIKQYMADRYSSFILYKPPFNFQNIMLWLGPFIFFILVTYLLFRGNFNK